MKVAVIGAGVGGLAAGALLAKAGYEVEVLERNSFIGGRCSSTERDGYVLDNFTHAFPMGNRGPHVRVAKALGEELTFISQDPASMVVDGLGGKLHRYPQRLDIRPLAARARMAINLGVKPVNYWGGFRLFRDLLRADDAFIESKDDVTLRDFLFGYTRDEQLHRFMNILSSMYFGIPYHHASAGEFAWCFREMFNAADFGYIKGSTGAIAAAYRRGLEKFGGDLRLNTPVEKIIVEGGRATGVCTPAGDVMADAVISNTGIPVTVKLAGEEAVGADYARFSEGLSYSETAVIVRFFLDQPVIRDPFLVYIPDLSSEKMFVHLEAGGPPKDTWIFMPVIDLWDPELVPAGRQLIIAATSSPTGATPEVIQDIAKMVMNKLYAIYPEMEEHVTSTEVVNKDMIQAASGHAGPDAIGLSQAPGQVGKKKPSQQTPVEGLYLVGADAGARGIGTEQAVASAEALTILVGKKHPKG
jgi:phytoene dehydrogenase-like protein